MGKNKNRRGGRHRPSRRPRHHNPRHHSNSSRPRHRHDNRNRPRRRDNNRSRRNNRNRRPRHHNQRDNRSSQSHQHHIPRYEPQHLNPVQNANSLMPTFKVMSATSHTPEEGQSNQGKLKTQSSQRNHTHHPTTVNFSAPSASVASSATSSGQHGVHSPDHNLTVFIKGFSKVKPAKLWKFVRNVTKRPDLCFTALYRNHKSDAFVTLDNDSDYQTVLSCNNEKWGQNVIRFVKCSDPKFKTGTGTHPEAVRIQGNSTLSVGGSGGGGAGARHAPKGPIPEAQKEQLFNYLCAYVEQTAADGVLNFTSLHKQPAFASLQNSINFNNNFFVALLSQAVDKRYSLAKSLIIAENGIDNIDSLSPLVSSCPNVTSIDLSLNAISDVNTIKSITGWKLRDIDLSGNPCSLPVEHQSFSTFKNSLTKLFPSLRQLNGFDIPPLISFRLPSFQTPIERGSFSQVGTLDITKNFIERYFPIYDSDRTQLIHFYVKNATFSLSFGINFHLNSRKLTPLQRKAMSQYSKFNHNLHQEQSLVSNGFDLSLTAGQSAHLEFSRSRSAGLHPNVIDNLQTTSISATHCILNLPPTSHDPSSFIVDSITLPIYNSDPITSVPIDTILVTICGTFYDSGLEVTLPFTRVFVLTKAAPGAPVEQVGCQSVIAADSLTIHMTST